MVKRAFETSRAYSDSKLGELRTSLADVVPKDEIVLTCGSFARREASQNSDIDFFVISQETSGAQEWVGTVEERISSIVGVAPADGGAFANVESMNAMVSNIGGSNDDNPNITRRMLFLLEGEWLFNKEGLQDLRRKILERYIQDSMTDHQLSLFLLNDVIRYYRTVAVDYEFKTVEADNPKPWGIRNIKLVFSRKLLYASGLFSVAMTVDRARDEKVGRLLDLFDMPVIDRMINICGKRQMEPVLDSYDYFLGRMADPSVRERLSNLKPNERKDPLFRDLKNEGHNFTRELLKLFENTFDSTHPIRRAVLF